MASRDTASVRDLLSAYRLTAARFAPLGDGLINHTLDIETDRGEHYVLQQVNPVFPAAVNDDIDALTRHLAAKGLPTTRIVPTADGRTCVERDGRVWRLLTFVDGFSVNALETASQAREAGRLLGRFHRAVTDYDRPFSNPRLGVHDTVRHLAALEEAVRVRRDHPRHAVVAKLASEILAMAGTLEPLGDLPDRVVHGDPKINNIIFAGDGRALCLVDLDTIAHMPLPLELGDALRSWCNPRGEDQRRGGFSATLFRGALEGYAEVTRGWVETAEWRAIVPATRTILVELAARFCADALNESYFGWDASRFASRSEHNEVRARGQLAAAIDLSSQAPVLDRRVEAVFGPG